MRKIMLVIIIGLMFIGCDKRVYKQYHTNRIYLRQLVNRDVVETHTSGSFFLVAGSVNSDTQTNTVVKLMGEVDGEYRFIQFDFEKVRIKIDNKVTTPYIVLNYSESYEVEIDYLLEYTGYLDNITIVCPEQYLPERLLPIQL
jgi:hypothetical protein